MDEANIPKYVRQALLDCLENNKIERAKPTSIKFHLNKFINRGWGLSFYNNDKDNDKKWYDMRYQRDMGIQWMNLHSTIECSVFKILG